MGSSSAGNITSTIASGSTYAVVGSGGTINIGTDAHANVVTVGSTTASASLTLQSGSGGNTTIAGNAAATITIGAAAQSGAINVGTSTGLLTMGILNGVAASAQTLNIASGTSASAAQTVNILNGTTPGANTTFNVMNGAATAGTQTIAMLSTGATRAGAVSIGNGAAAHTCIFGSTNTSATTTVNAGTGGLNLTGGQVLPITNVNHAATPYSLLGTDQFVAVDPTAGVVQITLPASPATGRFITVCDSTGQAGSHTITVSGNGNNISAAGSSASTATLTTAYSSLNLWFNGTIWNAQKIT
jgi:hypothetical protein